MVLFWIVMIAIGCYAFALVVNVVAWIRKTYLGLKNQSTPENKSTKTGS